MFLHVSRLKRRTTAGDRRQGRPFAAGFGGLRTGKMEGVLHNCVVHLFKKVIYPIYHLLRREDVNIQSVQGTQGNRRTEKRKNTETKNIIKKQKDRKKVIRKQGKR